MKKSLRYFSTLDLRMGMYIFCQVRCNRVRCTNTTNTLTDENGLRLTKIPNDEWKINGLSIEILEPFLRYRIIFNGLLRNVSIKDYEKVEYVHFSFM